MYTFLALRVKTGFFKQTLFLFFLLLFIFQQSKSLAQINSLVIQGRVVSEKNNEPLPFATISFNNNRKGTVSNQHGEFRLLIPNEFRNDSLSISFIGYQTKSFIISELNGKLLCKLQENAQQLEEVTITGLTAKTILEKAINLIPQNYDQSAFTSKGFYRLTSQRDEKYIHLSEAVFDVYRANRDKTTEFKLEKMRSIKDEKASHGLDLGLKPVSIFEYDVIHSLEKQELFSKKYLQHHEFILEGVEQFDDTEAYVISFDQENDWKKAGYKGKFYIDTENYTFLYLDYQLSPKGIEYYSYGDAALKALMALLDIHISITHSRYQISYKEIEGKYYLNNTRNETTLNYRSKRDHFNFDLHARADYLVTSVNTVNSKPFDHSEVMEKGKLIENQHSLYDQTFWDKYNIILPGQDFNEIAKTIEASNAALDYKKEIAQQINKFPKDKGIRIDSILTFYNAKGLFNGNALVTYQGETIFEKSFNNKLTNNSLKSQFRIGSTSKTFTSMLVMQLANKGLLKLSDAVCKYLPYYPHKNISIEQLLTHQSSIPNYTVNNEYVTQLFSNEFETEELIKQFCSDSLLFEPSTKFQYSNSNYIILSGIIESVTGKSYSALLEEEILTPLKMENSYFGKEDENQFLAKAYLYGEPEPKVITQNFKGAGGIISTTQDLLKWSNAFDNETLLPKNLIDSLWMPRAAYIDWDADYGYGWMIDKYLFETSKKHKIYYHPGTEMGFYTMFLKQPDEQITIILLSNTGDFPRFDITDLILQELD
ncbi:MAG: hypothetical protein CMO01_23145 [Thalassobius sp.]|nr:hypothetical protein [Thalassovita sp.]